MSDELVVFAYCAGNMFLLCNKLKLEHSFFDLTSWVSILLVAHQIL